MKQLILFLSFVLCINLISAQEYVSFPTDSARWGQSQFFLGIGFDGWTNFSYILDGDSIIDQQTYSKVYLDATEYWFVENPIERIYYAGALREDSSKNIFFKPHESLTSLYGGVYNNSFFDDFQLPLFLSDTAEYLLYDFSDLTIGDTISYPNHSTFLDYSYLVIDTTQFEIGGVNRKAYQLECSYLSTDNYEGHCHNNIGETPHYLIEGIGSTRGLLGVYHRYSPLNVLSVLTCFNDEEVIGNWEGEENVYPIWSLDECGLHDGNNVLELESNAQVNLYPNPTKNSLSIESSSRISKITILNSLGQEIEIYSVVGLSSSLDVSEFETGVYSVMIKLENGELISKNFIKH